MASPSIPSPLDDPTSPAHVSPSDARPVALDQSGPEAIRQAHLREEGYVKAVGKANYLYAALFGIWVVPVIRLTYLHLLGRVSADWSVRPGWLALQANGCVLAVLAVIAGYGLRRLKSWALRVEVLFLLLFSIQWPLSIFAHSKPPRPGEFMGVALILTALLVPLINLWDVRKSLVFTPEYRRVIAATPGTRIKAKISWNLKLLMLALLLIGAIIYGVSMGP